MKKAAVIILLLLVFSTGPQVHAEETSSQPMTYSEMMREFSHWSHGKDAQNKALSVDSREALRQRLLSLFPPFIVSQREIMIRSNAPRDRLDSYLTRLSGMFQDVQDNIPVLLPIFNAEIQMTNGLTMTSFQNPSVIPNVSITIHGSQTPPNISTTQNETGTSGTVSIQPQENGASQMLVVGSDEGNTVTVTPNGNISRFGMSVDNTPISNNPNAQTPSTPPPAVTPPSSPISQPPFPTQTPPPNTEASPLVPITPSVAPAQVDNTLPPPVERTPVISRRPSLHEETLTTPSTQAKQEESTVAQSKTVSVATQSPPDPRLRIYNRIIAMTERNITRLGSRLETSENIDLQIIIEKRIKLFSRKLMLMKRNIQRFK